MTGLILAVVVALICGASFGFVFGAVWPARRVVDLLEDVEDLITKNQALQAANYDLHRRLDEHRRTRLPGRTDL